MSYPEIKFTGADKAAFIKSSMQVWTKLSGAWVYIGKSEPAKVFSPGYGVAEWWDNESGTQVLYLVDPSKIDMSLTFQFAQVVDENALALAVHGEIDRATDPNNNLIYMGTDPGAFREGPWRFIGKAREGRLVQLDCLRGIIQPEGSMTFGTPGQFANAPVKLRFLQDTTQVDKKRDLGFWTIQKPAST